MIDIDRFHSKRSEFGYLKNGMFVGLWQFERIEDAYRPVDKLHEEFDLERPAIERRRLGFQPTNLAGMLKDQLIASNRMAAAQYRVEGE